MAAPVGTDNAFPLLSTGLRAEVYDVPELDEFGASGDVFDHLYWRPIFASLWYLESTHKKFNGMLTDLLLRGKSLKNLHRGKGITATFPTEGEKASWIVKNIGNVPVYRVTINFPNESTRVKARELTPERLKCILRTIATPLLLEKGKFPATSSSIGFSSMVASLRDYSIAMSKADQSEERTAFKSDIDLWHPLAIDFHGKPYGKFLNPFAAMAGCFSSKEIYAEDELQFPGCIWWSGLHAMMTDAVNKLRAKDLDKDVRNRFATSNFYGDFKRKMAARGIHSVATDDYYYFLEKLGPIANQFIRKVTGVTARESYVMDSMIDTTITRERAVREVTAVKTLEDLEEESGIMKPEILPLMITDIMNSNAQLNSYMEGLYGDVPDDKGATGGI